MYTKETSMPMEKLDELLTLTVREILYDNRWSANGLTLEEVTSEVAVRTGRWHTAANVRSSLDHLAHTGEASVTPYGDSYRYQDAGVPTALLGVQIIEHCFSRA
jgi:hypothetical protein